MKLILIQMLLIQFCLDTSEIIGYNPKKIEIINQFVTNENQALDIYRNYKEYRENIMVKSDEDFYWILITKGSKKGLYKLYSSLNYLDNFLDDDPVYRKIQYYFLEIQGKSHKVEIIYGYQEVQAVINRFPLAKEMRIFNKDKVLKLCEKKYLYRDAFAPDQCKIYTSINDLEYDLKENIGSYFPQINESVLDFEKHLNFLHKELKVEKIPTITEEFIQQIASYCFDYVKEKDIFNLYESLCSIYIKYLIDCHAAKIQSEGGKLFVITNSRKLDISSVVLRTINNLTSFEYNPSLYF